jgi:hypothetical protein
VIRELDPMACAHPNLAALLVEAVVGGDLRPVRAWRIGDVEVAQVGRTIHVGRAGSPVESRVLKSEAELEAALEAASREASP